MELFNIDLNYRGIIKVLNDAMKYSRQFVPMDTGLTRRSMEIRKISDTTVQVFFNPERIIGQIRRGHVVKDYYVKYIAESAKNYNWLSIVIFKFYDYLVKAVKQLFNNKNIYMNDKFIALLLLDYEMKKKRAKQLKDEVEEKRRLQREFVAEKRRLLRIQNAAIKEMKGD